MKSGPKIHIGSTIHHRDSENRPVECVVTDLKVINGEVMVMTDTSDPDIWTVLESFFYTKKIGHMSPLDGGELGAWKLGRKSYRISGWDRKGIKLYLRWYLLAGEKVSVAVRVEKKDTHVTYDVFSPETEYIMSGDRQHINSAGRSACRALKSYLKNRIFQEAT